MKNLKLLAEEVFSKKQSEQLLILYDRPTKEDNPDWRWRRSLASSWSKSLGARLVEFEATYTNNADLPPIPELKEADIVVALTEFSATAPLKRLAQHYGFRAASMPGFSRRMMPALEIDYSKVYGAVHKVEGLLKKAQAIKILFTIGGQMYPLYVDLRGAMVLVDDGVCRKRGTVINLPSGEAFVAPYRGETSLTGGYLPIQDKELNVYKVYKNTIIGADRQTLLMQRIESDNAVGNIAEIGFGVLGLFGIKASGRTLLDEKLGLHIALGRNDHFGGNVGPKDFKCKENVWHQDYVYIKEKQPRIKAQAELLNHGLTIVENNQLRIS